MPRKKHKQKDVWKPETIDKVQLGKLVNKCRHYLNAIEVNSARHSILTDLDYDELFSAVEEIYNVAQIGDLAQDNARRREAEKRQLRRLGLTDDS